ncbi:MAG: hypothetical protein M3Y27_09600, partial [Acidobacteriota bacterium]|nr:hypothetical protein [Acidobacteriota bacterium]
AKSLLHSSMIRSILLFRYLLFGPAPASAIRPSLSNRRLRGGKQRNHPVLISVGTRWLFAKPYIQQLRDVWEQHGRPRIPMQARVVAAPIATKIRGSNQVSIQEMTDTINVQFQLQCEKECLGHETENDSGTASGEENGKTTD